MSQQNELESKTQVSETEVSESVSVSESEGSNEETGTTSVKASEEVSNETSETQDATTKTSEDSTPESESNRETESIDADTESSANDDDDDVESDDENDDSEEVDLDLESKSKEELLDLALVATQKMTAREAYNRLKAIRPVFNDILRSEKKAALQEFIEAGNDPSEFVHEDTELRERFKNVFNLAKNARAEERKRIEEEKLKNFKKKEALLERLREITETDETEKSLDDVKALQQEWRAIRVVPADKVQELWDSYHFLLDKFYDNHSINIELKELDRKKNLEVKIELCKKVDELSKENSLKKSFILLNKYQEEFRNTGPVPREFNQEIWDRFRKACDTIYEQKRAVFDALEAERVKNLELKSVLIEKAELVAAISPKKTKDWKAKTEELDALMAEWKKIGPVPKSKSDETWKKFRKAFNSFYDNKSAFFKEINKERKANLILKEDICKRAEEIKSTDDFKLGTSELIKLQKEWKEIGPVPDRVSNAIWKRFRAACDEFFAKKEASFADKIKEEEQNLEIKKGLIEKLNTLANSEEKDVLNQLKAIQKEWNSTGFVPFKVKKKIDADYRKASDSVFTKFKLDRDSLKQGQMKSHYENLMQLPSGDKKLKDEAFKLKKKIKFLNDEIATLENNMEFFGRSKGAQKLKDDIAAKIEKTRDQIKRLKSEMKVIKDISSGQKEASNG